ncbi:MAG: FAD-dependent oxidoreductase [Pseudonocardia sp.]|nr:FAD-dependent oxidoreductase [Pseudonocardia sp.]
MPAGPPEARTVPPGTRAVVVGGGVAGISAAVVLAERGVAVTLLEAADTLGGRLGSWPHTLPDGTVQNVEHGFHAFFRHYHTWRAILRRADPLLGFLRPVEGYPVVSRRWPAEDLGNLPKAPPLNLLALFARSPSLRLREIAGADAGAGFALLAHEPRLTRELFDDVSAAEFLKRLGVSERARQMLFQAFARSFFCAEEELSAAELVAMFHYYFLGNPEGIGFDSPSEDHLTCIWEPLAAYLRMRGARVRTGVRAAALERVGDRWRVGDVEAEHVVLALDPGGLRALAGASTGLSPRLAGQCASLRVAPPFAVTRLWLDRDVRPERAVFSAVSGEPTLDSVAVYSRLERPSAEWAARTGGSVLELHSYASRAPDGATAGRRMRTELAALWPEVAEAGVVHEYTQFGASAPAFPPGGAGTRPGVRTDTPGVRVAGDFVEVPFASGLMERAAMSGVLAANDVLAAVGAGAEQIEGIPQRGLLAGLPVHRLGRLGRPAPATRRP